MGLGPAFLEEQTQRDLTGFPLYGLSGLLGAYSWRTPHNVTNGRLFLLKLNRVDLVLLPELRLEGTNVLAVAYSLPEPQAKGMMVRSSDCSL